MDETKRRVEAKQEEAREVARTGKALVVVAHGKAWVAAWHAGDSLREVMAGQGGCQVALCIRAQAGDLAARNLLVSRSMGLVYRQAHPWARRNPHLDIDDLAAAGAFGLFTAIRKYDPTRGASFATYATPWIRNHIRQAVIAEQGLKQSDDRRRMVDREVRALCDLGEARDRAIELVAVKRRMKPDTVRGVCDAVARPRPLSLDHPVPGQGDDMGPLGDIVASGEPDADERLHDERERAMVRAVIEQVRRTLPRREQVILDERLLDDEATLESVGNRFSISKERVRQIEVALRTKLKEALLAALSSAALPPPSPVPTPPSPPPPSRVAMTLPSVRPTCCRLCGSRLRLHNRYGICHTHGRNKSFDRATGRCFVCSATVAPRQRGAHALLHATGGPLSKDEIAQRGLRSAARRRTERIAQNRCTDCGRRPPAPSRQLCETCARKARIRGARHRRLRGQAERQLVMLTVGSETHSLAEWSRRTRVGVGVLWARMKKQWPPERILEPTKPQGHRARTKVTCVHGHPRTPENLWLHAKTGAYHCRICMRDRSRARRAAIRAWAA